MRYNKIKILFILGTRPEAIKLAPVYIEMKAYSDLFRIIICSTGQHKELLEPVLNFYGMKPKFDLNVMEKNQGLNYLVCKIIKRLDNIFHNTFPDLTIVQGDTTSALAGALASFYAGVPVAHIEAGLRSYDLANPFPEEGNRKLITSITSYHFAPTEFARENLLREGVRDENVFVTGNTVVDAMNLARKRLENGSVKPTREVQGISTLLERSRKKLIFVTCHRRESFGRDLENICEGIKRASEACDEILVVFPVHPNPNVQSIVKKTLSNKYNIMLINPLQYTDFLYLLERSYLILTDSGGVQEEAPSFGKPVLVLRKKTERIEGIERGISRMVGTDTVNITRTILELVTNENVYKDMVSKSNPYGDGRAAERIVSKIKRLLGT